MITTKKLGSITSISLLLLNLIFSCKFSYCQDPTFSQFDSNPLYYNPAFTGDAYNYRVGLNYRNHWTNIPGATVPGPLATSNIFTDFRLDRIGIGGVGLMLVNDIEGEGLLNYTSVGGLYSYHFPTGSENFNLYAGIRGSYNNLRINWDRLVFSDQLDPSRGKIYGSGFIPPDHNSIHYPDIDVGIGTRFNFKTSRIAPNNKKWSSALGVAFSHITRPDVSLTETSSSYIPVKRTFFIEVSPPSLYSNFFINPKLLIEQQGDFFSYTTGISLYTMSSFNKNKDSDINYFASFLFRNGGIDSLINTKSMIIQLGYKGHKYYTESKYFKYYIGFSADANLFGLGRRSGVSYEVSFVLILPDDLESSDRRWKKCKPRKGNPLSPIQ